MESLLSSNQMKENQLDNLILLDTDISKLTDHLETLQDVTLEKLGALVSNESPGETFDYFLREMKKTNLKMDVNLIYQEQLPFASIISRRYELSGTASFSEVYKFLWFLENGPVFFDIKSIFIERIEDDQEGSVRRSGSGDCQFTIRLFAFNRDEGPRIDEIQRIDGAPRPIASLITNNVSSVVASDKKRAGGSSGGGIAAPQEGGGLAADGVSRPRPRTLATMADNLEVMALTPNSVIFKNPRGESVKVRKGDEYYGGTLKSVDVDRGKAIFEVTTNGIKQPLEISATKY